MLLRKVLTAFIKTSASLVFIFLFLFSYPDGGFAYSRGTMEVHGKVYSRYGVLEGVVVTDGFNVTTTDKSGSYRLRSHPDAKFIYLSTPAGYTTTAQDGMNFYRLIDRKVGGLRQRIDFELSKLTGDQSQLNIIVTADPQIGYEEELPMLRKIAADIRSEMEHLGSASTIGVVCGDLVEDIKDADQYFDTLKRVFADTGVPFHYLPGNHDMEVSARSNFNSKKTYERFFGPRYYSFSRGDVHFVFLDNVFHTGRTKGYIGYLEETQLRWLEQDLSFVPSGKLVVLLMHVPTYSAAARSGEYEKEEVHKVLQNRQSLYKLLEKYNAHIFSGHEHYQENYQIRANIYEHVQPALSGIFWQAPYNSDGTPLGYKVYKINGTDISWYFKAAGQSRDVQFDTYKPGADKNKPNAIVANVWNYGPGWKVYWYENEKRMGEMIRYRGWDPAIAEYVRENQKNFRYKNIGAGPTEHLFYAVPHEASAEITVEVVDRFGNRYYRAPRSLNK